MATGRNHQNKPQRLAKSQSNILNSEWLPDMDLNNDKQIQSLLCYRYTIGQTDAFKKLKGFMNQSSRQTAAGLKRRGEFKNHRKSRSRRGNDNLSLWDKGTRHGFVNRKS